MSKYPNGLLQYFKYEHLPAGPMQETSKLFSNLASLMESGLPDNPEKTAAFRKLLEAKDCAVRAIIYKQPGV